MDKTLRKRDILLAVCGMSPAVITETIWALKQEGVVLDEIHVITTAPGREPLRSLLARNPDGPFYRLCGDLEYEDHPVRFDDSTIHLLKNSNGEPEDDLMDSDSHRRMVTLCIKLAWEFTASSENRVYFSIAGGRKTMSSALSLAAQLTARKGDQLLHVLVEPPYDRASNFFYPGSTPNPVTVRNEGKVSYMDSHDVDVTLVKLPVMRFRDLLSEDDTQRILKNPDALMDLPPSLTFDVDCRLRVVRYGKRETKPIPAVWFALFLFLVEAKRKGWGVNGFLTKGYIVDSQQRIDEMYAKITGGKGSAKLSGIDDNFGSYFSKLKQRINPVFSPRKHPIVDNPKRQGEDPRFGVNLEPEEVRILDA